MNAFIHLNKSAAQLTSRRCGLLLCALAVSFLSACQRYEDIAQCADVLVEGDTGNFEASDDGMAVDTVTGMRWYRCNAGERFADGQCLGTPVELVLADALAYAQEFSDASGRKWRLPTQNEMDTLRLDNCVNPSVNRNVFPSITVNNYWTSTPSNRNSALGCTTYTYNGNDFCSERKDVERPFLLVLN